VTEVMSPMGPGCVKTPQARKRGEWFSQIDQNQPRSEIVVAELCLALTPPKDQQVRSKPLSEGKSISSWREGVDGISRGFERSKAQTFPSTTFTRASLASSRR
jgi:hypothetical protein